MPFKKTFNRWGSGQKKNKKKGKYGVIGRGGEDQNKRDDSES